MAQSGTGAGTQWDAMVDARVLEEFCEFLATWKHQGIITDHWQILQVVYGS